MLDMAVNPEAKASPGTKYRWSDMPKLALSLWAQMQKAQPEQEFYILLTLDREPNRRELKQLERLGLHVPMFHRKFPSRLLPGHIRREQLENQLVHCQWIRYIEGVANRAVDDKDADYSTFRTA